LTTKRAPSFTPLKYAARKKYSSDSHHNHIYGYSPACEAELGVNECIGLNALTEERAMMSSWRVTLLALGFRRTNRPAGDVDQAIIEG
jgi:hypothetical protein